MTPPGPRPAPVLTLTRRVPGQEPRRSLPTLADAARPVRVLQSSRTPVQLDLFMQAGFSNAR